MPSISIIGVRALFLSISGRERRSKIVRILSDFSAAIPAAVTCEGSAERNRRSERVVAKVGMEVGYPPRERKLWMPSTETKGGDGREAMDEFRGRRDQKYFA